MRPVLILARVSVISVYVGRGGVGGGIKSGRYKRVGHGRGIMKSVFLGVVKVIVGNVR